MLNLTATYVRPNNIKFAAQDATDPRKTTAHITLAKFLGVDPNKISPAALSNLFRQQVAMDKAKTEKTLQEQDN